MHLFRQLCITSIHILTKIIDTNYIRKQNTVPNSFGFSKTFPTSAIMLPASQNIQLANRSAGTKKRRENTSNSRGKDRRLETARKGLSFFGPLIILQG